MVDLLYTFIDLCHKFAIPSQKFLNILEGLVENFFIVFIAILAFPFIKQMHEEERAQKEKEEREKKINLL